MKFCSPIILILFLYPELANSQALKINGQLSSWGNTKIEKPFSGFLGIRYIPSLSYYHNVKNNYYFESEISVNTYGNFELTNDSLNSHGNLRPYRIWAKFASSQWELRLGLQKINFGSAMMIRPLMWFDKIDPRDPLQITDGVYGALGRYYFMNNGNIWAWVLYGNEDNKGWEIHPTAEKKPEYGTRVQWPILHGEIGGTFHHRNAKLPYNNSVLENRFALDGKWDIIAGIWFETTITHQENKTGSIPYQHLLNIGADYTFGIGNGLHLASEYFRYQASSELFGKGEILDFIAISADYPVGLIDDISIIVYHSPALKDWYRFINWSRTYDKWTFYLMAFWNPEQFKIYQSTDNLDFFTGKGFQIMVVFNY